MKTIMEQNQIVHAVLKPEHKATTCLTSVAQAKDIDVKPASCYRSRLCSRKNFGCTSYRMIRTIFEVNQPGPTQFFDVLSAHLEIKWVLLHITGNRY